MLFRSLAASPCNSRPCRRRMLPARTSCPDCSRIGSSCQVFFIHTEQGFFTDKPCLLPVGQCLERPFPGVAMYVAVSRKQKTQALINNNLRNKLVRAMGIEPTSQAWEARVLPLNDARMKCGCLFSGRRSGCQDHRKNVSSFFVILTQ